MFEDKCLNMNRVAWQFHHYVSVIEPSELFWKGCEKYKFKAKPYFNCRERGFVIEIIRGMYIEGCIAFYGHRNTDGLIGLYFKPYHNFSPSIDYYIVDDIPEEYFPDQWAAECFSNNDNPDFEKAVDFIRETLRLIVVKEEKKNPATDEVEVAI